MAYTAGRGWIEYLRIDTVEANHVFGLRLNVWTSIVVFLLRRGVLRRRRPPAPGPRGVRCSATATARPTTRRHADAAEAPTTAERTRSPDRSRRPRGEPLLR